MRARLLGSVIVPAHNEVAVIRRTLTSLVPLVADGEVEVVVACNGCTDGTARMARSVPGMIVIEVAEASKVAALNAADLRASGWPRLYLDADVEISARAVRATLVRLAAAHGPLAARPAYRYELGDASVLSRAYHRVRSRVPALNEHLWGAGAYGVSEAGHRRFGRFPAVTADDYWVDRQFSAEEREIVDCPPVLVRPPRTARAVLHTLTRVYGGNRDVAVVASGPRPADGPEVSASSTTIGPTDVLRTVRGPRTALDAAVYVGFAVVGRLVSLRRRSRWARDETSRLVSREMAS